MEKSLRELLLKDLCARLPYGIKALETYHEEVVELICICPRAHNIEAEILSRIGKNNSLTIQNIQFFKPYLRPLSSMTEEEKKEFTKVLVKSQDCGYYSHNESATTMVNDWYLSKGFDVRGLIPKGLALPATEDMYK